MYLVMQDRFSG